MREQEILGRTVTVFMRESFFKNIEETILEMWLVSLEESLDKCLSAVQEDLPEPIQEAIKNKNLRIWWD